ncbi:MAG: septal ring lytic transglycosylase RlpA family protein [Candidatus Binatia bacterium]
MDWDQIERNWEMVKGKAVPRRNEPPTTGLVFLLVSSLLPGCGWVSGSGLEALKPRSAEAASLDGPALRPKNNKAQRQVNHSGRKLKKVIRGEASWYGPGFHGKKTASGEIFDQRKLTAAHKTLPLGTKAKVTNLQNGNTVEVEINDRGPYVGERVIDLSHAAADVLGFVESGITLVRVELLPEGSGLEGAG